ncbi:hypothetical protein AKJ16_DCAP06604 [Drosera capensis]
MDGEAIEVQIFRDYSGRYVACLHLWIGTIEWPLGILKDEMVCVCERGDLCHDRIEFCGGGGIGLNFNDSGGCHTSVIQDMLRLKRGELVFARCVVDCVRGIRGARAAQLRLWAAFISINVNCCDTRFSLAWVRILLEQLCSSVWRSHVYFNGGIVYKLSQLYGFEELPLTAVQTRVRAAQASNWCDQIDIVLIYTSPVVFRAR